jgi:hypothetical protein
MTKLVMLVLAEVFTEASRYGNEVLWDLAVEAQQLVLHDRTEEAAQLLREHGFPVRR